jgi:hypothetical protein
MQITISLIKRGKIMSMKKLTKIILKEFEQLEPHLANIDVMRLFDTADLGDVLEVS